MFARPRGLPFVVTTNRVEVPSARLLAKSGQIPIVRGGGAFSVPAGVHLESYELLAELGAGRTGVSYLAAPRGRAQLGKLLVVRLLRPELIDEEPITRAFLDQARLSARLVHGNIVRTIDLGVSNGRPFVAMEYVEGQSLEKLLGRARDRRKSIPLKAHLRIALDLLAALHFAHSTSVADEVARGVVHGQISPRKVLLTTTGQIKVIDFGFPHTTIVPTEVPTAPLLVGIRYAAPELVTGGDADWRADVFSVGAILWEGMLDRPPWGDLPDVVVLEHLLSGRSPRVSEAARNADPALAAIIERAMERDPNRRFPSAQAMRHAVEQYVSGRALRSKATSSSKDPGLTVRQSLGALVSELSAEDRPSAPQIAEAGLRPSGEVSKARPFGEIEPAQPSAPSTAETRGRSSLSSPPAEPPMGSSRLFKRLWQTARNRRLAYAGAVVGALAIAGAGLCERINRGPPRQTAVPPSLSASAAQVFATALPVQAPSVPPASAPPTSMSRVSIVVSPLSARVFLDGNPVPNPFISVRPRDNIVHVLRAEARGYGTRIRNVSFAADRELEIELAPAFPFLRRQRQGDELPSAGSAPQGVSSSTPGGPSVGMLGIDKANPYRP